MLIPVYYLTDRCIQDDKCVQGGIYGKRRRYPFNCQHHMYYGTIYVAVPNVKHKTPDTFNKLGWQSSNKKVGNKLGKLIRNDRIDPSNPEASKTMFFDRLAKALDKSETDKLCVFVHGAADTFEGGTLDAVQLAYYIERPLVLYSWPSVGHLMTYGIDNGNSEWSQGHFNMFIKDLLEFRNQHPLQVTLMGHSVGNRLIIRGVPVFYSTRLVSDFELISPDIDLDTCKHYMMDYQNQHVAVVRLYVSRADKVLHITQRLFGGYYRLGEHVDVGLEPDMLFEKLVAAHSTANSVNSASDNTADSAQEHKQLERIDFSVVDKSFWGHNIPFELVANMIHTGHPGTGFELVPDTAVEKILHPH